MNNNYNQVTMESWENNDNNDNNLMNHYNWGSRTRDDTNDDSWNLLSYNNNTNTYDNTSCGSERYIKDLLGLVESPKSDDDSSYVPSESSDSSDSESMSDIPDKSSESTRNDNAENVESKASQTNNENTSQDDEEWLEMYDEKRQDTDGGWYTRRQFYDYYGSDEAWDNLDPDIYHQYRYDSIYGEWHCKEEFYQHYGTNDIWKKMNPKRYMKRRVLCDAYHWASYLPDRLQDSFIKRMLQTYDFYV